MNLEITKAKTLLFDVEFSGLEQNALKFYFYITVDDVCYGFEGKIVDGKVKVVIPAFTTFIKDGIIKANKGYVACLEVTDGKFIVVPWEDKITFESSSPTVKAKLKEVSEAKVKVKIQEEATSEPNQSDLSTKQADLKDNTRKKVVFKGDVEEDGTLKQKAIFRDGGSTEDETNDIAEGIPGEGEEDIDNSDAEETDSLDLNDDEDIFKAMSDTEEELKVEEEKSQVRPQEKSVNDIKLKKEDTLERAKKIAEQYRKEQEETFVEGAGIYPYAEMGVILSKKNIKPDPSIFVKEETKKETLKKEEVKEKVEPEKKKVKEDIKKEEKHAPIELFEF